jgi:23S rRNA (guanosine2251-2'-O)-methyltransferase
VIAFAEPLTEADLSDLVGAGSGSGDAGEAGPPARPDGVASDARPALADGAPPEVAAEAQAELASHEELGRRTDAGTMAFLVVVDGVTDPQNLGALLRSAECAGVTGVVLPRHRGAHVTPTVTKVAAGAVEHVRIAVVPGVPGALQELERLGVWTVGLDERGPEPVFRLQLGDRPLALVIGAEGRGLAPLSRQRCDVLARIPLRGSIDSLNVSAAGAIAMFEVARQRSAGPG